MGFFEELEKIPQDVRYAVGDALTPTGLIRWWNAPNPLLGDRSPRVTWEAGEHQAVLDFIASAQSGDMS